MPSAFPGGSFEAFAINQIGMDYGLASQIFRCRFGAKRSEDSVVVKLWRTDTPAGVAEPLFYRIFASRSGIRVPVCFHAEVDNDQNRGVLVLEDLVNTIQGDCLQQLTSDQAVTMARSLAALHASWLEHAELREAEWLRSSCQWEPDGAWFASRRTIFLERFGGRLDDFARSLLDRIEHTPQIVNEVLADASVTLLHGDLHLDNVLFEDNVTPVILDWSRCAKGPPVLDLADLLFEMCRPEQIESTFATYVEALRKLSAQEFHDAPLHAQLGAALLRRFATYTCGIARWRPRFPREEAMIHAHIERAVHAVRYWRLRDPDLFSFV